MKFWQVDSFADRPFTGNPAAVCILPEFPSDSWMQDVAMEMNCAETAFVVPTGKDQMKLRWFTPNTEVDLCGHATMAAMQVLRQEGRLTGESCRFETRSGTLVCSVADDVIQMDMPATPPVELPDGASSETQSVLEALRIQECSEILKSKFDYLVTLASAEDVRSAAPDMNAIIALDARGVIVTAKGDGESDFVSRFFAPKCDVNEDPVTGSAHCCLTPYWSKRLGKDALVGYQASRRGGYVQCQAKGDRVVLAGKAQIVLTGELHSEPKL